MKIVLTGGGTGGHFYPLIAVAEELRMLAGERGIPMPELYFLSNAPYDEAALRENAIVYKHVPAGKLRTYFSIENATDMVKTMVGLPTALSILYKIFPDVVFSKGGYTSFPVVLAARILKIPIMIHDSDTVPGRANLWAGKFADRIGVSYPEAATYFKNKDRIACVGNPVRLTARMPLSHDAHAAFKLSPLIPTLLILGGSQGAEAINVTILQALKDLVNTYQIIHQVGQKNLEAHNNIVDIELADNPLRERYRAYGLLSAEQLRAAAGAADLVISRAGSGSIFEIACWGKPSILVPIPQSVSRDQRENAYVYARSGAAEVIEQHNFTPHVLLSELTRLMSDAALLARMREGAAAFKKPDAARMVASELLRIALMHER